MGGSGSKGRGYWPFSGSGGGDEPVKDAQEQSLARVRSIRNATPFVFTRRSSLFFDEDGDLAHEFYEETVVTKNGRKKAKLKRIHKNLIPQGIIQLDHPCIHVDFPVVICEVWHDRSSLILQRIRPPLFPLQLLDPGHTCCAAPPCAWEDATRVAWKLGRQTGCLLGKRPWQWCPDSLFYCYPAHIWLPPRHTYECMPVYLNWHIYMMIEVEYLAKLDFIGSTSWRTQEEQQMVEFRKIEFFRTIRLRLNTWHALLILYRLLGCNVPLGNTFRVSSTYIPYDLKFCM